MSDLLVHLDGAVEETLNLLLEAGFFKTKAEVVRTGILKLGEQYHSVKTREEFLDELAVKKMEQLDEEVKKGKRKLLTAEQALGKYAKYLE